MSQCKPSDFPSCISQIEARVIDLKQPSTKGRIVGARMKGLMYFPMASDGLNMCTSTDVELEIEGVKRKKTIPLQHSFCPFCGIRLQKDSEGAESAGGEA